MSGESTGLNKHFSYEMVELPQRGDKISNSPSQKSPKAKQNYKNKNIPSVRQFPPSFPLFSARHYDFTWKYLIMKHYMTQQKPF